MSCSVCSVSASSAGLVRSIPFDARKSQRQSAGILRALLQIVEGNFDDQLRTHEHDMALTAHFPFEQRRRLPLEQRIGHPLECLAEHDEAVARGIASAKVEIAQPPAPSAAAPFGGEHDEIERANLLDLQPRASAAARRVRRIERLRHHPFVAAADGAFEELGRGALIADDAMWHGERACDGFEQRQTARVAALP